MRRKGLGKGQGMGYKNLAPMDSHVHSLSAKGVKTYSAKLDSRGVCAYCWKEKSVKGIKDSWGKKVNACLKCRREMDLDAKGRITIKTPQDAITFLRKVDTYVEDLSDVKYRVYDKDFSVYYNDDDDLINYAKEQQDNYYE